MAKNKATTMYVHVVDEHLTEIGKPIKTNTISQEVTYKKRMWAINHISDDVKIRDYQGAVHTWVNANEADGTLHFLTPLRMNLYGFTEEQEVEIEHIDKETGHKYVMKKKLQVPNQDLIKPLDLCTRCGDRITIDARNQRDLLKRKTIDTFWGLDNSQVLLLIIMGIVAIGALGGVFYLIGQNQTLQSQVTLLTPKPEPKTGTTHTDFGIDSHKIGMISA